MIDHPDLGVPPPFNAEVIPIMLRLSENWKDGDRLLTENLIEGLNLRYRHLSPLKDIDGSQAPLSLEQTLVFSAVDLNISIQELIVVP